MKISENEGTRALRDLIKRYHLRVALVSEQDSSEGLLKVVLTSNKREWSVYLSDEYKEFRENRQLLGVYMVLKELRYYASSNDFLEWCTDLEVNPSNSDLRVYYMELETIQNQVKMLIGDYTSILDLIHFDIPFRDELDSKILLSEG